MNMCMQIILCFFVYIPLYRTCSNSQLGTLSHYHNEGVDDVHEIIKLDHDVEGIEEVPNLPRDILEALNRESKGSKSNTEETEVINLANEGEIEKLVKIGVNFPKGMKDELIALLNEFKEIVRLNLFNHLIGFILGQIYLYFNI